MNLYSLPGQKFGTLTVLRRVRDQRGNQARFVCRCECGREHIRLARALISGRYEPCGCGRADSKAGEKAGAGRTLEGATQWVPQRAEPRPRSRPAETAGPSIGAASGPLRREPPETTE